MSEEPGQDLPLASRHQEAGARFAAFAGYQMPMTYTSIKQEHAAVRQRVGLFDVSHMGEVWVRGPKALEVVNGLISQDLRQIEDGQACYGVLCHEDGGIVDDLVTYRVSPEEILICVNAANRAKDFAYLKEHAGQGATLEDESEAWAQLALQGPAAQAVLEPLTDLALGQVGYYRFGFGQVAGARCLISRTGYTGEDGFEIYIPVESAEAVFDAVVKAGQPHGLELCGLGARDTLRLEAKFPLYGQDLNDDTNPYEAGLAWVVKLNKPEDFVGRAALEAIKAQGVTRRLRGLVIEGRGIPRAGYELWSGQEQVGSLTSGTWSPTLEVGVGLGYVNLAHANDDRVEVQIRNRRIPARLTRKPFYTRNKE